MNEGKHIYVNEYVMMVYRFVVLLLIYMLLRVSFYLFNQSMFDDLKANEVCNLMFGGMVFDISAIFYTNIAYYIIYVISLKRKYSRKGWVVLDILFYVSNGVAIALNCVDFVCYETTMKRTTWNMIETLSGEPNVVSKSFTALSDHWQTVVYYIVVMILLAKLTNKIRPKLSVFKNDLMYLGMGVIMLSITILLSCIGIRGNIDWSRPIDISHASKYTTSPEQSAIVLNTTFSIIRTKNKKQLEELHYYDEEQLVSIYNPIHKYERDSLQTSKKNIVIIIVDNLGRELVGAFNPELEWGRYEGYTPFLDTLSCKGKIFTNAYANCDDPTDALLAILAGVPTFNAPYMSSEYANNAINSIASLLSEEGYHTALYHGAINGRLRIDALANIADFDVYKGMDEYGEVADFDGTNGIWDHKYLDYLVDELSSESGPFCVAVLTLSSHYPYAIPEDCEDIIPEEKQQFERSVMYTDYSLRKFFEKAEKEKWYGNTLFVITGNKSNEAKHEEYRNNAQKFAVPIIFYAPGDTSMVGVDSRLAQHTDILPTTLAYVGYDKPFVAFGENLSDSCAVRFVVNHLNDVYQIYDGNKIVYYDGQNMTGVYDMIADPELKENLIGKGRDGKTSLRVNAYLQQYNNRMINNNLTIK